MRALLNNLAFIHHDDLVRILNGREAMSNDQSRASLHQGFQRGLNLTFGLIV